MAWSYSIRSLFGLAADKIKNLQSSYGDEEEEEVNLFNLFLK